MTRKSPSSPVRLYALGAIVTLLAVSPFVQLGGMRLVGFQYGVFVDHSTTVCPDQVVSQNGTTITLSDGRSFRLGRTNPEVLAGELARAENRVFVDTAGGVVYGRFRRDYCGFSRPERSQIITLPLVRKDLPSHGRDVIASIDHPATTKPAH
jgi:hypothetical protein